jgi:hypothetical protein
VVWIWGHTVVGEGTQGIGARTSIECGTLQRMSRSGDSRLLLPGLLLTVILGAGTAWSSRTIPPPDRPRPGTLVSAEQCRHDRDCTSAFADLDRGRCDRLGKRVQAVDLNQDGRPDLWKLHGRWRDRAGAPEWMTCKQLDLRGAGHVDVQIHYDRQGREEIRETDLDHDGRIEMLEVFSGPRRATRIVHRVGPGTVCRQQRCQWR